MTHTSHSTPRRLLSAAAALLSIAVCARAHDGHAAAPATRPTAAPAQADRAGIEVELNVDANPWTHLDLLNDPDAFQFAIVTDNTGRARPGVFQDGVAKLNLMKPQFVMSVGDLIQGYTANDAELDRQWTEFQGFVQRLEMPFFYVPGNHDYSNKVMAAEWRRRFGRPYYHFRYRDVLFCCVNTEAAGPALIGAEQVEHFRKVLRDNADVRWTLVFMHRPLWKQDEAHAADGATGTGWADLEAALKKGDRKFTVFAGHLHNYQKDEVDGRAYYDLATTGGARGSLPEDVVANEMGIILGRFDHFAWVTMTDHGPHLANILLDGVWPGDVRTGAEAWTNDVFQRAPVMVEPIFTNATTFGAGGATAEAAVHLENPSDVPLRVRARFEPHGQLTITPNEILMSVPPRSSSEVSVTVAAERPLRTDAIVPAVLRWTAAFATSQRPERFSKDLRLTSATRLGILPLTRIPPAASESIVIDGDLTDWGTLPLACDVPHVLPGGENWHGPADGSFNWAARADDRHLYLAVRATDDDVVLDPSLVSTATTRPAADPDAVGDTATELGDESDGESTGKIDYARVTDALLVQVDGREDPHRSASRGLGSILMTMVPGEATTDVKPRYPRRKRWPAGARAEAATTDGGYVAEIAIPLEHLRGDVQKDDGRVRINITVNDVDRADSAPSRLSWQPAWDSAWNISGSGTFALPDSR